MANDESVLREVDQELAEERLLARVQEHGTKFLIGGAALVIAVGGWQVMQSSKNDAAEKSAVTFREATVNLDEAPEESRAALAAFSAEAPAGYAVIADLSQAGSLARNGERLAARDLYRKVYTNGAAPKRLAQIARIRAALTSLDDGREEVMRDLGDLESDLSAIGFHAREIAGIAALNAGDYETAKGSFDRAATNLDAPVPVQRRAEEFAALAAAGKAGISLGRDINVDDLTNSLGNALGGGEENQDGSDHDEHGHEAADPAAGLDRIEGAASAAAGIIEEAATGKVEEIVPAVEDAIQEALPDSETPAGADDNPEPNLL